MVVALAALGAAFFAGADFLTFAAAGVSTDAVLARRGRPAAAVVSYSLPRDDVTVAGGSSTAAAAALAFAGVAFAFAPFFGGIVTVLCCQMAQRCECGGMPMAKVMLEKVMKGKK